MTYPIRYPTSAAMMTSIISAPLSDMVRTSSSIENPPIGSKPAQSITTTEISISSNPNRIGSWSGNIAWVASLDLYPIITNTAMTAMPSITDAASIGPHSRSRSTSNSSSLMIYRPKPEEGSGAALSANPR